MESLSSKEKNLIKDIRNIFRLKKEQIELQLKIDIRNLFRLKRRN